MKMAKPSERDIDAAGELMSLLHQLDRGDYPNVDEDTEVPDWFDEDNHEHLRAFYDAVKNTIDKAPGFPGRVIGGMCYVIMYDKNEIIDPASDVIELHPKLVAALAASDLASSQPTDGGVRNGCDSDTFVTAAVSVVDQWLMLDGYDQPERDRFSAQLKDAFAGSKP